MASKIFIATPAYQGICGDYYGALLATVPALESAGHSVFWKMLEGCCYVHTARNKLARDFLVSDADYLLFIDSDIGWNVPDMLRLCARNRDIVGAAAPFRAGDPGFPVACATEADGRPMVDPATGLIGAIMLPTAVMRISRAALMAIAEAKRAPLIIEHKRDGSENERYLSFFDFEYDAAHCCEFGEDVTFCRKAIASGISVWIEPDVTLRHHGVSFREGNYHDHLRALPGGGGAKPADWTCDVREKLAASAV